MTAAIGPRVFDASQVQPDVRDASDKHQNASAFGDLLHGTNTRGAARGAAGPAAAAHMPATNRGHTGDEGAKDEELASPADKRDSQKTGRHPLHAARGRADDDRKERDDDPTAATADDARLRDRMPLLATLHELGQRGVGQSATAPPDRPAGLGAPGAALAAGSISASRLAEPANREKGGSAALQGRAAASVAKAGQAPGAAATAAAMTASTEHRAAADASPPLEPNMAGLEAPGAARAAGSISASRLADPANREKGGSAALQGRAASVAKAGQAPGAAATTAAMTASTEHPAADATPPPLEPNMTGVEEDGKAGSPTRSTADGREAALEKETARRTGLDRPGPGSVSVTTDRSFPAPAAHPPGSTTASVVNALAAARNQPAAAPVSLPQPPPAVALQAQMLRIELHPAELGSVVANLRMAGGQLSVELKPETAEAYRRLSHDSDTITKSLQKLGLAVDSVTVIQPSIAATPAARADAGNQTTAMPGRDGPQFQSGTSGGGGDNSGGRQAQGNSGHGRQTPEHPAPAHRERAGGALFI